MQKPLPLQDFWKRLGMLLTVISGCLMATAQDGDLPQSFNAYQQATLQEKLYLHTDKPFYLAGEICWFKVYNTDAFFNRPLGLSKLAYVEILDKNNTSLLQAKLALKEGMGEGSLVLPASLASGHYLLRAYTRWMKNFSAEFFFEKQLTIINTRKIYIDSSAALKQKYDVQFFPEGGNLVYGIQSRVAFRAVDQNGRGINCNGSIVNENADTLVRYAALKFGMGSFLLTPDQGHTYTAVINLPEGGQIRQALPPAFASGYVMQLTKTGNGQLKITVQSSADNTGNLPVYLFVHTRGMQKAFLSNTLNNGAAVFTIDTGRLAEGISTFTVFNAGRQPVCERLFFKRPLEHLIIHAGTDTPVYGLRKKVTVGITAANQDGQALPANLSMSVYRVDDLTGPGEEPDIRSYLWLSSDLVGHIESPAYYLNSPDTLAALVTENLMMTQGWRRFNWEDVLKHTKPVFEFSPEYKGHIVQGRVVNNANGQPEKNVECYLSVVGTRSQFRGTFSDDSGKVKFEMSQFYGDGEMVVQTADHENVQTHMEIVNPFAEKFGSHHPAPFLLPENNAAALVSQNTAVQVQNTYAGNQLNQFTEPDADTTAFYSKPDRAYLLDDYVRFTTVEEILREYVPEVNVRRHEGKFSLPVFDNIRREFFKIDPLILLDGVPITDADKIMSYDPLKIRKLEVVARMYFYGSMFFDGIVNFITYKGDMPGYELGPHATVIDYGNLQLQRQFFSPVYDTKAQLQSRMPDFRSLMYWSPALQTDNTGKREAGFYTSDLPGRYAVDIQGLTKDGKAGNTIVFFDVKQDLSTLVHSP